MLSSWKTRFQSLIVDTERGAPKRQADSGDDSQVSHLQRMLADLRRSQDGPYGAVAYETPPEETKVAEAVAAQPPPRSDASKVAVELKVVEQPKAAVELKVVEQPKAAEQPKPAEPAPAQAAATAQVNDAATDEAFESARRFIEEHREAVQSLLQELGALEECVNSRAQVTEAFNAYTAAKQRAADAAAEEQKAKKLVEETAERLRALQRQRANADKLLEPARAEVQSAKAQIAELEKQLRDAQQLAEQKSAFFQECETRSKSGAADEAAAASEAAKAAERHVACQNANATLEKEVQAAKERAERLKQESGAQSVAAISDVRKLALKIAQGGHGLNGSASSSA